MPVTYGQVGAVCPQCGSPAAVHSIEELAQLARGRLGQQPGTVPPPQGGAGPPQPGGGAVPQQGWAAQPGYSETGPVPGYAQPPRPGPPGGWRGGGRPGGMDVDVGDSIEDAIASVALGAAAKFIGRSIGKKMQNAYQQKVAPALAAKQEEMLRVQIAIAEKHPDLRACLNDQVIFLAGGSRVLPMPNLGRTLTVEQADALVAQLRNG
jgi:hypothetical protein